MKPAQAILLEALEREAEAQRLLLAGRRGAAAPILREVAGLYRRSWEAAHATAYGRLMGMLKAAIIAGGGEEEAAFARAEVGEPRDPGRRLRGRGSRRWCGAMTPPPRAAAAMAAGARRSRGRPRRSGRSRPATAPAMPRPSAAIVRDFEAREEHVTGVAIADTALDARAARRAARARGAAGLRRLLPQP